MPRHSRRAKNAPSAWKENPMYPIHYLELNQWMLTSILCSVHQKVVEGKRHLMQSKNTCPLCRERFHEIKYRNRIIQVASPPSMQRPQRAPLLPPVQQMRRIIYVPMLLYPQPQCFLYPAGSYFMPAQGPEDQSGVRYPMGSPAFFIPTLWCL